MVGVNHANGVIGMAYFEGEENER